MRPSRWLIVVFVGALVGLFFAGFSTYDFVQHLDRQVHSIHCSFIPGISGSHGGSSGCQAAMMSPFSSVWRTSIWGGVPISLPAMSVFAFLLYFAVDLLLGGRQGDRRRTGFLVLATALPLAASLVMGTISLTQLGTACKLCVGIYLASVACFVGAVGLWRRAVAGAPEPTTAQAAPRSTRAVVQNDEPAWAGGGGRSALADQKPMPRPGERTLVDAASPTGTPTSLQALLLSFAIGVGFVLVPVGLYAAAAPDHARFIGKCDGLAKTEDPYGVMVQLGGAGAKAAPAIELLDPMCPTCKAFEERLDASGLASRLDRKVVLFPLDNSCNWMVDYAMHPGACAVSEAVLCAAEKGAGKADEVIAWAFAEQDSIRQAAEKSPDAAAARVKQKFPELASCVGSPGARSRLNKSLRWAVQHRLPVLTPQLYVDGVKLCDEDVDLGLEYALSHMLDKHAAGTLAVTKAEVSK